MQTATGCFSLSPGLRHCSSDSEGKCTQLTLVSFGKRPRDAAERPLAIRALLAHSGENDCDEAFIGIDLAARSLEFRDKAPEYHAGIVAALSG